ncbi:MAG: selenium-dependent molybdenum cofactor biosynthesis protein YqeB [Chloroflexi bacterium]|nr:selenium-dependent molybdenum cofactor biosynthesis protein YqeB [Chloroflexota bacterium]
MSNIVLLRGGGDLASGVALRLHRAGIRLLITELPTPLFVRRKVAFGEAVYAGKVEVEGVWAQKADGWKEAAALLPGGIIPVIIDPDLDCLAEVRPLALVDARMIKTHSQLDMASAALVIGLGPGFEVGVNCHTVVETKRGHHLGRLYWQGSAAPDTGVPGSITKYKKDRVLRAPASGTLEAHSRIGQQLKQGDLIASVSGEPIIAPFDGVLRGLIHPSVSLVEGMKIGDLDPRNDPDYVELISDKALAIGGGVLEALLTREDIRQRLWA